MGADLYIKPLTEAARKKWSPVFDDAVKLRNQLAVDLRAWESILAAREQVGNKVTIQSAKDCLETTKKELDAAQKAVSGAYDKMYGYGYFRDSYNGTSVLWRLGLSWWQDIPGGTLTVAQLQDTLEKVRKSKLKPCTAAELKEMGCTVDNGENSVKAWQNHYRNKKRRLMRFLARAIRYAQNGGEVYFSL